VQLLLQCCYVLVVGWLLLLLLLRVLRVMCSSPKGTKTPVLQQLLLEMRC